MWKYTMCCFWETVLLAVGDPGIIKLESETKLSSKRGSRSTTAAPFAFDEGSQKSASTSVGSRHSKSDPTPMRGPSLGSRCTMSEGAIHKGCCPQEGWIAPE